jgi:hypothetical protein
MPSRNLVLSKLHECFPDPATAQEALQSLDRYGDREWHICKDGVHLAILKLSERKLWRLREFVQIARKDFRDVLVLATRPEQARRTAKVLPLLTRHQKVKPLSAGEESAIQLRDQAQWGSWLRMSVR